METLETRRNFQNLYAIQDEILQLIKNENIHFYLSGETALHRFHYQNYRYSEDLDFFNDNQDYKNNFDKFLELLSDNGINFKTEANGENFKRIIVKNELKIDFINESTPHLGDLETINGILVDNKENILANKLTAVISRSESSDELDLTYSMLKTFPIQTISLKDIDFISKDCYEEFKDKYKKTLDSFIQIEKEHSISKTYNVSQSYEAVTIGIIN